MAEELIYSIRLDGADENVKKLVESKQALATLGAEQKKLKEQQKQFDKQLKDGEITQEQYNEAVRVNLVQQVQIQTNIKKTDEEMKAHQRVVQANATATGNATGSIKQMSAELSRMRLEFTRMSAEEQKSAKGRELQAKINDLDAEYKELQVSIGNTQVMVGSYQEAVNSLLPVMGGLGGKIQGVIGTLGQIKAGLGGVAGAMKAQAVATNGSVNSLKLFKIALISTGVGAIVVALGSLIGAFLSTQRGIDAVNKVLTPLKEVFATLVGFLQDKALAIFDRLKSAIDNPKKAFQDLLDFVKTNVTNRFNGFIQFFKGWAGVFVNTWKVLGLNIKKVTNDVPFIGAGLGKEALKKLDEDIEKAKTSVKKGVKDMADGFIAVNTGIANGTDKLANIANGISNASKQAIERGKEIQRLTENIRRSEITYRRDVEANNRLAEEQKLILEDTNLTMAQRKKAGQEYLRLLDATAKRENDLTNMKLKLAKLEMEANDTDDATKKEYYDMVADNEARLAALTGRRIEVRNKLNSMDQEAVKKLAEEKKKADDEAKKLEAERVKTEQENSKKLAEQNIRDLEFEQKKEKILFTGTKAEEFEMERKHQEQLLALKLQYAETTGEDVLALNRDTQLAIFEIDQQQAQYLAESRKTAQEQQANALKEQQNLVRESAEAVSKSMFENEKNRIERTTKREIEALTLRRQAGEITAEEFDKKRLEIDKKAFERKKKMDTKEAVINGIVAISKIFAQRGFLLGLPEVIAMGVQTATQVSQIQAQKFRFGGNVGGKSHNQGGTMIEAERGEAVIMREAVNPFTAPILSAINTAYGGAPIEALNQFGNSQAPKMEMQQQRIEVINVATDTNTMANRVKNLQNSRRF
jgi:hypothetical protein